MTAPQNPEEMIPRLSSETFNQITDLAVKLVEPIRKKHGPQIASNVLLNALVSATAWQMGNHMLLQGMFTTEEDRQRYCTKRADEIFAVYQKELR